MIPDVIHSLNYLKPYAVKKLSKPRVQYAQLVTAPPLPKVGAQLVVDGGRHLRHAAEVPAGVDGEEEHDAWSFHVLVIQGVVASYVERHL